MWICCVLSWRGVRRDVMPPGRWTALFFLDEATALAAGHRPCGYCRRADYRWFGEGWRVARGLGERPRAGEMDTVLHRERVDRRSRRQITRSVVVGGLPDGVMVRVGGIVGLLNDNCLLPWSFGGYQAPQRISPAASVELLTPPTISAVIGAGYRPLVHSSAAATNLRLLT